VISCRGIEAHNEHFSNAGCSAITIHISASNSSAPYWGDVLSVPFSHKCRTSKIGILADVFEPEWREKRGSFLGIFSSTRTAQTCRSRKRLSLRRGFPEAAVHALAQQNPETGSTDANLAAPWVLKFRRDDLKSCASRNRFQAEAENTLSPPGPSSST
jgi:hypothetical protein